MSGCMDKSMLILSPSDIDLSVVDCSLPFKFNQIFPEVTMTFSDIIFGAIDNVAVIFYCLHNEKWEVMPIFTFFYGKPLL